MLNHRSLLNVKYLLSFIVYTDRVPANWAKFKEIIPKNESVFTIRMNNHMSTSVVIIRGKNLCVVCARTLYWYNKNLFVRTNWQFHY